MQSVPETTIVEVTPSNSYRYLSFLHDAMMSEFPPEARLPLEGIEERINKEEEGMETIVKVVCENEFPLGFMIYHLLPTGSGDPTGFIEYAAVAGDNKGRGLGGLLFGDAHSWLISEGAKERVIETEIMPRVVAFQVHDDIDGCYSFKDESIIFVKEPKEMALRSSEETNLHRTNMMYDEAMGMKIITGLAYCQPNIDRWLEENYVGQHRVPLDLQITTSPMETDTITGERLREIVFSLACHNYHLGKKTDEFMSHLFTYSHDGNVIDDSTKFPLERYRDLKKSGPVARAFDLLQSAHTIQGESHDGRYVKEKVI